MEPYSRLQSELHNASERVAKFQQEAAVQRIVRDERITTPWRKRLATQLHGLADRLEPAPYSPAKGNLA